MRRLAVDRVQRPRHRALALQGVDRSQDQRLILRHRGQAVLAAREQEANQRPLTEPVDEIADDRLRAIRAVLVHVQIVDEHHDQSIAKIGGVRRDVAPERGRKHELRRRRRLFVADLVEHGDLLRLLAVGQREVLFGEAVDGIVVRIDRDDKHGHEIGAGTEDRLLRGRGRLLAQNRGAERDPRQRPRQHDRAAHALKESHTWRS